jgi:hypothetical protein
MNNVIVAWAQSDTRSFEAKVPLLFVGQRNQKLGFNTPINVVFLEGLERLDATYQSQLRDLGYVLHDASTLYAHYAQKYEQLSCLGDYERKCFLRWPVIRNLFAGEPLIHYDGDIVFNEDPAIIAQKVSGKTFILQGCPAFTSIADPSWFEQYTHALDAFTADINGYSSRAWKVRAGWEVSFATRWSGSRFRPIISSDQDLLSHLIHTNEIKQDSLDALMHDLDDYIVFQNPLLFHMYNPHIPYAYTRENGIDFCSYARADGVDLTYKKKILLWHMQSCFNFYASKRLLLQKYMPPLWWLQTKYNPSGPLISDMINKKIARFIHNTDRLSVYRYFFQTHDFSCLLNGKAWWKKGVFV